MRSSNWAVRRGRAWCCLAAWMGDQLDRPDRGVRRDLVIIFAARTAINTPFRIVYPFLPAIAQGLGLSLTSISGLITLRMIPAIAAPLFGPLTDRHPRRRVMEVALLLFVSASLVLGGMGTMFAGAIAFLFYGVAKTLHDLAAHAYVGDASAYGERGRAMGLVELSWSAAWLLSVPASGFLIERFGWNAPFAVLALLGLVGAWLTHTGLPSASSPSRRRDLSRPLVTSTVAPLRRLLTSRSVVVLLTVGALLTVANELPFIVYGGWMEDKFELSLSSLGLASTVIGVAEAAAELGAMAITDLLGIRYSVVVGLMGLSISLILLPILSGLGLGGALVGVAMMMVTFEFGIVSLLALATEVAPERRASLMSLNASVIGLSRVFADLLGGWLWQWRNIAVHVSLGAGCAVAGTFLMTVGVRNGWHAQDTV